MTDSGSGRSGPHRAAWRLLLGLLIVVALFRVAATYRVFSETADEHHFVAGIEWWDRGVYTYTIFHPPLTRIFSALPLYLAGARAHGLTNIVAEKNAILYGPGGYVRNLSLARLGVLPFLGAAIIVVWMWARRLAGNGAAFVAALLFSTLPPVLAHAGLTTTDMALTATLTLLLFSFCLWLEEPTTLRTLLLGTAGGLAIISKFSAFPFFFFSALAIVMTRAFLERDVERTSRRASVGRRIVSLAWATAVGALLIWASYRFSWGSMPGVSGQVARRILIGPGAEATSGIPVPAPEFWDGLRQLRESVYLTGGHPSYLLGKYSTTGWWYYFPIALAVKTPLAFLLIALGAISAVIGLASRRRDWKALAPILAAGGILVPSLFSRTDIGVRHVLPVYPLLAIATGCGVVALWNARRPHPAARIVLVALVGWHLLDSIRAHPDYLAYFNELAGRHPDRVLLDSNLDWGQDLYRLSAELSAHHVGFVALKYFGNADVARHGMPPIRPLPPDHPTAGWVAISEMWRKDVGGGGKAYRWLSAYRPVTRVGSSILLYFIPEPVVPADIRK